LEGAGECDRALLARAQACAPAVYWKLRELLGLLPARERRLRRVAEDVIRLLEEPEGVHLAYYPAAPVIRFAGAVIDVSVALCFHYDLEAGRGGRRTLHYIAFFPPAKLASDPELRYILAHELAHAAGYRGEEPAARLADELAARFPSQLWKPTLCAHDYARRGAEGAVDLSEFARWIDERPAEFREALSSCCEELKPVG
jgi:hypothetical protein